MARGLRLGRDDAELGTHEAVEQRGLADVRPAHEGCEATAAVRCAWLAHEVRSARSAVASASRSRRAASCSARRRLAPCPLARIESAPTAQLAVKVWLCDSPT